jgi:hypothetical protein
VLGDDVIAEEPRLLGTGVGDQRLARRQFQLELVAQEPGEALLDFLRFGLRAGESEEMVIGLCGLPDYADDAPGTWLRTGDCAGVVAIILSLSR